MTFLIFDFDGTLADSLDTNIKVINELAEKYGFNKIPKEDVRHKEMKALFKEVKIPLIKLPLIIEEAMNSASHEKLKPFKGIREVLLKLKKRFNLGIITANSKANAERFLKENNLEIFDFVHSAIIFNKNKAIKKVLKDFNILDAYYIGDETRDILAAKKAKIKCIAVTWGYNGKELLNRHSPDFIIDKPTELLKINI